MQFWKIQAQSVRDSNNDSGKLIVKRVKPGYFFCSNFPFFSDQHYCIHYLLMLFWTPSISWQGPIKQGLFVLPSILPSFCLCRCFCGIVLLIFSKFWYVARIPCEFVYDSRIFGEIFFCPKNGPKTGFFEFIEKFGH